MKCLFYIFLIFSGSLFAQEKTVFEQATEAYSNEKYQQAIANYEQILENGKTSVAVYYNLANAHYKLDHIAPSIYYYEKALQLKPNDKDVLNNLAFAKKMTIDAIEPLPKTGFSKWVGQLIGIFGFDTWAWIAVFFSVLFALLILGYYFAGSSKKKRLFFVPAMFCLVLGVLSFFFANARQNVLQTNQFAIVFAQETNVNSEPSSQSELVFLLHEGTKIEVNEAFGDWLQIELADGKQGWVKKGAVKKL